MGRTVGFDIQVPLTYVVSTVCRDFKRNLGKSPWGKIIRRRTVYGRS